MQCSLLVYFPNQPGSNLPVLVQQDVDPPVQQLSNLKNAQPQHEAQAATQVGQQVQSCHCQHTSGHLDFWSKDQGDLMGGDWTWFPAHHLAHYL